MKVPSPKVTIPAIVLVVLLSLTYLAGVFFKGSVVMKPAHKLNVCASSRQFLVEFRMPTEGVANPYLGPSFAPLRRSVNLEIDGEKYGTLSEGTPVRRFLCEGNHEARLAFQPRYDSDEMEDHRLDFALSRASLFDVVEASGEKSCILDRDRCTTNMGMVLESIDPDDVSARALSPLEEIRKQTLAERR